MSAYRIVRDRYLGFEVQIWRWWFPFWVQAGGTNTQYSIADAEKYARTHATKKNTVKYLGNLRKGTQ